MAAQPKPIEIKKEASISIKTPIPLCKEGDFYVEVQYTQDDDRVKIIIGVSTANNKTDNRGQHAFIMYFDDIDFPPESRNCKNDVMLDSSGHYGLSNKRRSGSTDLVFPQYEYDYITISITGYRKYFKGLDETLYAYTFYVPRSIGKKIKSEILECGDRSTIPSCTLEATDVLIKSGMFSDLEQFFFPIKLKRYLDNYKQPEYDNNTLEREKISFIKREEFNLIGDDL